MSAQIERVARAICEAGLNCLCGKMNGEMCVDEDGRNAPCRATKNQLILSYQLHRQQLGFFLP